jgi:hypothetical protein
VKHAIYHPTVAEHTPKLAEGKSLLEGKQSASGRTRREHDKQQRRFQRIRARSAEANRPKK